MDRGYTGKTLFPDIGPYGTQRPIVTVKYGVKVVRSFADLLGGRGETLMVYLPETPLQLLNNDLCHQYHTVLNKNILYQRGSSHLRTRLLNDLGL